MDFAMLTAYRLPAMVRVLLITLIAIALGGSSAAAQDPGSIPSPAVGHASHASPYPSLPAPSESAPAVLELWPAPSDPMERTVAAGLEPQTVEHLVHHVHAHLSIFVDGVPVLVPAGIGIDTTSPDVMEFDDPVLGHGYGGISGCAMPCISPLHTHFGTGVLHTESDIAVNNRLGQFFTEWGVRLDADCVGDFCEPATPIEVYLDGEPYTGDPAAIELTNHLVIAIVIGTPPPEIPATYDFSQE
jgi:hypothetical protein